MESDRFSRTLINAPCLRDTDIFFAGSSHFHFTNATFVDREYHYKDLNA